jgi:hypothetical protein
MVSNKFLLKVSENGRRLDTRRNAYFAKVDGEYSVITRCALADLGRTAALDGSRELVASVNMCTGDISQFPKGLTA